MSMRVWAMARTTSFGICGVWDWLVCVEWEVAVQLATIDDVVVALDDIIARARDENSRLGYFPALYRRVTVEVGNGIERGAFEDGEPLAVASPRVGASGRAGQRPVDHR
jgi:hypothetical protein